MRCLPRRAGVDARAGRPRNVSYNEKYNDREEEAQYGVPVKYEYEVLNATDIASAGVVAGSTAAFADAEISGAETPVTPSAASIGPCATSATRSC